VPRVTVYEDFGSDAIRFHPVGKREGVERHGIKRDEIRTLIKGAGFENVKVETAYVFSKKVEAEGESPETTMEFPFLICLGRKPS